MKIWLIALLVLLTGLQLKLWFGDGGVPELHRLRLAVEAQAADNLAARERNEALRGEVQDLRKGLAAVEERARSELGMIKRDETFYQIVEE